MAKAENKTKPTQQSAQSFIRSVEHERRREDGLALLAFFTRVTQMPAKMWGSSIIGFGRYHYKYESGREGDFLMTGFSPRKAALSIYIMPGYRNMTDKMERLGKHKIGKSCLYINKLSDIDMDVLGEIVLDGLSYLRANYETFDD